MTLQSVQESITRLGASWTAGETSRSNLTPAEIQSGHMGTRANARIQAAAKKFSAAAQTFQTLLNEESGVLPPDPCFNWLDPNDNGGLNIITEPRDQSPGGVGCNSCVAFAIVGAVEGRMNLAAGQNAGDVNLSEGYLFFRGCGAVKGCAICSQNGWSIGEGLESARIDGIPNEESFPYNPATTAVPGPMTAVVKLTRWRVLNSPEIKRALILRGPLIAEMNLFDDFQFYQDGVYENVSQNLLGTHAVTIVGYCDDAPGRIGHWVCKNSWGTDWGSSAGSAGTRGFFRIRYGACGVATSFPVYEPSIQVQLSLEEATSVINRVIETAKTNQSLRNCLKGRFKQGMGTGRCTTQASREIVQACLDIFGAYPSLEKPFKDALA